MLPRSIAEFLIGALSLVFTYLFSTTVTGAGQAYVARWAGDRTPEDAGFLSWRPEVYFDFVGFICALLFGFGWGTLLPFRPIAVSQPYKSFKVLCVYLAQPFIALSLSIIALTTTIILIGPKVITFAIQYSLFTGYFNTVPAHHIAQAAQGMPLPCIVVGIILITMMAFNIFVALISLLRNICYYALYLGAEHGYDYMRYAEALFFFGPLALFILFASELHIIFLRWSTIAAFMIAHMLGVAT